MKLQSTLYSILGKMQLPSFAFLVKKLWLREREKELDMDRGRENDKERVRVNRRERQ